MLSLIGSGCHRLSELAARTGKPSTHLSGALAFLTGLRYIRSEMPFGESLRSTKRSLYKIDDPFLNFYFTFIVPEKSRIDLGLSSQVLKEIKKSLLVGEAKWTESKDMTRVVEELKRKSANLPMAFNHEIVHLLFVKHKPGDTPPGIRIFDPEDIIPLF